ncbi:MAG: sensor histidine kinase, partial [Actinobacteria bacterium]|nr:sensor histidine kinase [Actinomycetota bacterium]NIW26580.1 sensor histidine kinase [Actinomycetota bacterium]
MSFFFSPGADRDMVAGFAVVPRTGWGVMTPQPVEELQARAAQVRRVTMVLVGVGIVIAGLAGWWLSVHLVRPAGETA